MRKEILNKIGIKAKKDIESQILTLAMENDGYLPLVKKYGLTKKDMELLRSIETFCEQFAKEKSGTSTKIEKSRDAFDLILPFYRLKTNETVYMATLSASNNLIHLRSLNEGNIGQVHLDYRRIIQDTLNDNARNVIIFHNHPSGIVKPSPGDMSNTEKLRNALKVFEIALLDHIIIGKNSYYSFADEKETRI